MGFVLHVAALLLSAGPPSVAISGSNCVRVDAPVCDAYVERFANQLGQGGRMRVVTPRDVAQVLGLERQKQLLGCSDGSECTAELAGALGVDGVLSFGVTRSEQQYFVTVRVLRARDGTVWATRSTEASSEPALFKLLESMAVGLSAELTGAAAQPAQASVAPWVVAGAGAVSVGVGLALYFGVAKGNEAKLRSGMAPAADIDGLLSGGRAAQVSGLTLLGVGGAAVVGGLLWGLLLPKSTVTAGVVPTPQGLLFTVGGAP